MNKYILLLKKIEFRILNKIKYIIEKYNYNRNYYENSLLLQNLNIDFNLPLEYFESLYSVKNNSIINIADLILNHKFNVLGNEISFGNKIIWNKDLRTGFIWDNKFYKDIKYVNLKDNNDVKIPWELSRLQHLYILIKAYEIKKDYKYIQEVNNQILDWIEDNPYKGSVNWTCAMEIAIRAVNLIVIIEYMKKLNILNNELNTKVNELLIRHGEFIYGNLEKNPINSNNHYIADLAGLMWISIYFSKSSFNKHLTFKIKKWFNFAYIELEKEIENQILDEGVNYEISIPYHSLVSEIIIFTDIMMKANGIQYSKKIQEKLFEIMKFINLVTKKNGNIPLIGDMDSGRFIFFIAYGISDKRNFQHLLAHYRNECKNFIDESYNKIVLKKESGYAVYKNDNYYFISRCGVNAMNGLGNHNHNDNLSFELNIKGVDFIIDPGTFCYTQDVKLRNKYRSTSNHNVLQIEDFEQNDYSDKYLFKMKNESDAEFKILSDNSIIGEVKGYRKKINIIYKRKFDLQYNKIEVSDFLKDDKNKCKNIRLFLDSNVIILKKLTREVILENSDIKLKIISENDIIIKEGEISTEYGMRIKTNVLVISFNGEYNKMKFIIMEEFN